MKVYVWKGVGHLTSNYHSNGGVLVVAKSIERARELVIDIAQHHSCEDADDVAEDRGWLAEDLAKEPLLWDLAEDCEEKVIIFPDSGCC